MGDNTDKKKLPATSAEISELVKRIETLEGRKGVSPDEIAALKADLAKATAAAGAKPERKRDKWGWPIE